MRRQILSASTTRLPRMQRLRSRQQNKRNKRQSRRPWCSPNWQNREKPKPVPHAGQRHRASGLVSILVAPAFFSLVIGHKAFQTASLGTLSLLERGNSRLRDLRIFGGLHTRNPDRANAVSANHDREPPFEHTLKQGHRQKAHTASVDHVLVNL